MVRSPPVFRRGFVEAPRRSRSCSRAPAGLPPVFRRGFVEASAAAGASWGASTTSPPVFRRGFVEAPTCRDSGSLRCTRLPRCSAGASLKLRDGNAGADLDLPSPPVFRRGFVEAAFTPALVCLVQSSAGMNNPRP